jgi:luciferase family oxidoreductase group 1
MWMGVTAALSVLDTCPIIEGEVSPATAFRRTRELAQAAERLGYRRFWLSEHHNMPGTASAATAVVVGHVAAATSSIRVGSGGVMLPNHAPYVVAEQFGTLATLYPGRIDLGLGRSPGTDGNTLRALRRDPAAAHHFPEDLQELQFFLAPASAGQPVRAIPGAGAEVPLWVLGSSLSSAQLAAAAGLPFVFAAHVQPAELMRAIQLYRARFQPSQQLDAPYVMPCINVYAAETDREARRHFSSLQAGLVNFFRGRMGGVRPPVDDIEAIWSPQEKQIVEAMQAVAVVGSVKTVEAGLRDFIAATQADEVMIAGNFHDPAARIRSLELISEMQLAGA